MIRRKPSVASRPGPITAAVVPAASAARTRFLEQAAHSRPVVRKDEFIIERCAARAVLDIGCINHSAEYALSLGDRWLHDRIRRVAASTCGLDTLESEAARLRDAGYDIAVADAQSFDLGTRFDVVVAADVIEHLSDLGSFLRSVRRHMTDVSALIITTPNPFAIAQMLQVTLRGRAVVNAEHTVWLDPNVLYELLQREGFEIVEFAWIDSDPEFVPATLATRLLQSVSKLVARYRPLCNDNYAVVARISADSALNSSSSVRTVVDSSAGDRPPERHPAS